MRNLPSVLRFIAIACTAIMLTLHHPHSTWAQASCETVGASVRICGVSQEWQRTSLSPYAAVEYVKRNEFHAQVISEPSGSRNGLSLSQVSEMLIDGMIDRADRGSFEVLVRGTNQAIRDSEIIVSRAKLGSIPFIFSNTIYVGKSQTIQIITWRIARELTEVDRDTHLEFGSYLVLMPDF